jgi:hypothetical protein
MQHFAKAERLYGAIGDIVSYSYTIWSMATLFIMIGEYQRARREITQAQKNFRKTKDPRGLIYCEMALGQIDFLHGRRKQARGRFQAAYKEATGVRFRRGAVSCRNAHQCSR